MGSIQFEIDNDASVIVLPVQVYKRAIGDNSMKLVTKISAMPRCCIW